jgi:hypothetical protein
MLCHVFVTKIALQGNVKFSNNSTYHTKPSSRIGAGDVAVRAVLEE